MSPSRAVRAVLGVAAIAAALGVAAPAAAQQAAGPGAQSIKVAEAIAFRRLQSELMVAALSCNDRRLHAYYNLFVERFRPALGENARVLKAHFRSIHGAVATRRMDDFMTRLANEASLSSMADRNFCDNSLARFEAISRVDENQTAGMIVEEAELVISR